MNTIRTMCYPNVINNHCFTVIIDPVLFFVVEDRQQFVGIKINLKLY